MQWLLVSVWVIAVAACAGAGDEPSRTEQCERLREHLIDLRVANTGDIDVRAHRAAMEQALGTEFLTTCERSVSDRELACGLRAIDAQGALACSAVAGRTR